MLVAERELLEGRWVARYLVAEWHGLLELHELRRAAVIILGVERRLCSLAVDLLNRRVDVKGLHVSRGYSSTSSTGADPSSGV